MDAEQAVPRQFVCLTLGCTRLVTGSHLHCCSECRSSSGVVHTIRRNRVLSRSTPFTDNQEAESATTPPAGQQMGIGVLAIGGQATATSSAGEVTADASSTAVPSTSRVLALAMADQTTVPGSTSGHSVSTLETASASASSHVADQSIVQTQHEPIHLGSSDEDSSSTQAADDQEAQGLDLNDMD